MLGLERTAVVAAEWVDNGPGWMALLLGSPDEVLAVRPGAGDGDIGLVALYPPGSPHAIEVRAFFPKDGMLIEDPVTGSLNASVAQWLTDSGRLDHPLRRQPGHGPRAGGTGPRVGGRRRGDLGRRRHRHVHRGHDRDLNRAGRPRRADLAAVMPDDRGQLRHAHGSAPIAWATPLEAVMSGSTTGAPPTVIVPPSTTTSIEEPPIVRRSPVSSSLDGTAPSTARSRRSASAAAGSVRSSSRVSSSTDANASFVGANRVTGPGAARSVP